MTLPRVLVLVSALLCAGWSAALAQFPPPPNPNGAAFPPPPPPPGSTPAARPASPFPAPGQQPAPGANPCEAFVPIRSAAEKDAQAIQAAGKRKASREEVCPLFKKFAVSEAKMVKFLKDYQAKCGVPPEAVKQATTNHAKTIQVRNQVCSAGPAPAAPRLSDVFGAPVTTDSRPNRGTFDTLTGNPLNR